MNIICFNGTNYNYMYMRMKFIPIPVTGFRFTVRYPMLSVCIIQNPA